MKYLIWIILALALFLRTYRVSELTGFYFDQGRDAKVVWQLWHDKKAFLIGPTTGIEGIFLGPFYYYLIAPFYIVGNGNPVYPAVALALINCTGIYLIYLLGRKFFDADTGLFAALFISFSQPLVQSHRWLSNPTPLPFFAAIAVYLLLEIINGSKKEWVWLVLGLVLGLSLQLEAASAVFFIPAVTLAFIFFRKGIHFGKNLLHLFFTFCLTLIPQLLFNFRHENLLVYSFKKFLVTDKSFAPVLFDFYPRRLAFYYDSFSGKFFTDDKLALIFSIVFLVLLAISFRKVFTRNIAVLVIWFITPLFFLMFYHGNNGYVWDYYFTGVYPIFILFVSWIISLALKSRYWQGRILAGVFTLVFLLTNISGLTKDLSTKLDKITDISLGTSRQAVDWVYQDAKDRKFNVDVYVPPVIPHSYDYLFLWRGNTKFSALPSPERQDLLYVIYESDSPHPERLNDWLLRQSGIAVPEKQIRFGGVTVERRWRTVL
jgi:4-amino-4-deoxy-L-arabinose transferase-like glycosyltransferase